MLDQGMRRMLRDFGRALSDAISESGEASRKLREIRDRGYSLYLLLDGESDDEPQSEDRLDSRGERSKTQREEGQRIEAVVPGRKPEREPQFRINGTDLSFLRSIGIDPTRRQRRRRS